MRFFLSTDGSSHWYVVPVDKKDEWEKWQELPEDNEDSWEAPEWAERVGGSPELITFTNPKNLG